MTETGNMAYKGAGAVFIEDKRVRAVFTARGAKMVSLYDKAAKRELLLQCGGDTLKQGSYDTDYNSVDVCGFDDMFPSIDPFHYEGFPWKGTPLPDHGEVWGLDWLYEPSAGALAFAVHGVRLPYRLSKRITLQWDEPVLRIEYAAENLSPFSMDFIWAAHIMLDLSGGAVLTLPGEIHQAIVTYSHTGLFGSFGDTVDLSDKLESAPENPRSYSISLPSIHMEKCYLRNPVRQGFADIRYRLDGCRYRFRFPHESVPHLGLLISNGLHIGNCLILEPCTAPFDRPDRARAYGQASTIAGNSCRRWYLEVVFN